MLFMKHLKKKPGELNSCVDTLSVKGYAVPVDQQCLVYSLPAFLAFLFTFPYFENIISQIDLPKANKAKRKSRGCRETNLSN